MSKQSKKAAKLHSSFWSRFADKHAAKLLLMIGPSARAGVISGVVVYHLLKP